MNFDTELALWAVLLVALAANPVWFFPQADEPATSYRAVEMTDENRFRYAESHPETLECYTGLGRACAFETAVLQNGTVLNSTRVETGDAIDYQYVVFSSGFYEPAMERSGERVRLTLEPRSVEAVVRNLSYPYAEATDQARTVVRNGNVTLHGDIPDRDRIVRRDETYYYLRDIGGYRPPLGGWVPRYRWVMWLGTVPLSVAAMWRWT